MKNHHPIHYPLSSFEAPLCCREMLFPDPHKLPSKPFSSIHSCLVQRPQVTPEEGQGPNMAQAV